MVARRLADWKDSIKERVWGLVTYREENKLQQLKERQDKKNLRNLTVGRNINSYRKLCDWGWKELGSNMGMTTQHVKKYAQGKPAGEAMLKRFADCFNQQLALRGITVTVDDLLRPHAASS
ncbi:MAG TPA: hypothetical protein VH351_15410 [Bryobacteraceae bacterium]|nr:hypothetical protein [Bryobacteraceae bacterium]